MPDTDATGSPGDVNLETHPLVAKLHADPDKLTDLVALVGYLGPSKREGYVRLYVDLTFRNYYEIPTEGIVSTSPTDASDENSPTTMHVAGGTQVEKVSITSQSTEARFLQGSISSGYLSGAGTGTDVGCSWPTSPSCWCRTANNCQQGAAQVGGPSMVYSCWCPMTQLVCGHTQHGCEQQAAQAYTDTLFHTCACTYENCGQAGARARAQSWPASGFCNFTKWQNCGQVGAGDVGCTWTWQPSAYCNYTKHCGQAGAQANAEPWPTSPSCWCIHTGQGCT